MCGDLELRIGRTRLHKRDFAFRLSQNIATFIANILKLVLQVLFDSRLSSFHFSCS